jgi:hypothetical protein
LVGNIPFNYRRKAYLIFRQMRRQNRRQMIHAYFWTYSHQKLEQPNMDIQATKHP